MKWIPWKYVAALCAGLVLMPGQASARSGGLGTGMIIGAIAVYALTSNNAQATTTAKTVVNSSPGSSPFLSMLDANERVIDPFAVMHVSSNCVANTSAHFDVREVFAIALSYQEYNKAGQRFGGQAVDPSKSTRWSTVYMIVPEIKLNPANYTIIQVDEWASPESPSCLGFRFRFTPNTNIRPLPADEKVKEEPSKNAPAPDEKK